MLDGMRGNSQSFLVKLIFAIIILVFVFWGVNSFTRSSGMVATVNGLAITPAEFDALYYQYAGYIRSEEDLPMVQNYILSTLIERKLLQSDANRIGVTVSPWELRQHFAAMPEFTDANGNFSPDLYRELLAENNIRPSRFEADTAASILPDKMYTLLTGGIYVDPQVARIQHDFGNEQRSVNFILFPAAEFMEQAAPTEQELLETYQSQLQFYGIPAQIKLEYITLTAEALSDPSAVSQGDVEAEYNRRLANGEFHSQAMVSARHILILVDANAPEAEVAAARTRIEGLRDRILVGEDFATVARQESQDPGSAANGGDLGFFSYDRMVPEFAEAAFSLPVGEISEPVRSSFGFHLIKVEDKTEEHTQTLAELEESLRAELAASRAEDRLQALAEQVFAQVQGGLGLDAAAFANNVSLLETQLISQDRLSTAIGAQAADSTLIMETPAGQLINQVLQTSRGYTIARVLESNPPGVRDFEDVRPELTQRLTREAARRLAQEAALQARQQFVNGQPGPELAERVRSTVLFGNDGYIPGIGMSMQLARTVFELPMSDAGQNLWLGEAFIGDDGAVLASLKEVAIPDNDNWLIDGPSYINAKAEEKAWTFFSVYMSEMHRTASIRPENQAYFQYWQ